MVALEEVEARTSRRSLKAMILKASSWILAGHFLSLSIRFVGTLVLSRIFTPEVFGIMAVVLSVQIVTHLFTDIGISQAVIQSPSGRDSAFLNTAWTIQVMRGFLIWGLGLLVAVCLMLADHFAWLAAGSVYAYPELPAILAVACLSAVIMGFQTTKVFLASRDMDMKRVTIIDLTSQLVALAFTITAGYLTRSIWSYVVAGLLNSFLSVAMSQLFLKGARNHFALDPTALQRLSKFGGWIFASSGMGGLAANGDRVILGGIVTPAVLGLYSIASNLVAVVDGVAGRIFGMVALPALSAIARDNPGQLPSLLHRIRLFVDPCMVALAGFIYAAAPTIISSLYDARYAEASAMLKILSLGLLFTRYNLAQSVYISLGLPNYLVVLNIARLASITGLIPLFFYLGGEEGAVLAIALHMVPVAAITLYLNSLHKLNNFKLELFVLCFWPAGWAAGIGIDRAVALLRTSALGS